ncbi:hypothetical protein B296_00003373 [Ensete ventricosum]|uniref:Uncharacterized protein n=1 Tax=Ensete ventricosum TaxID=4639 RepID=A0A427BBW7_ENSVE|nr:hypothetical protein B296_00003373 [Ensete ventricosum]
MLAYLTRSSVQLSPPSITRGSHSTWELLDRQYFMESSSRRAARNGDRPIAWHACNQDPAARSPRCDRARCEWTAAMHSGVCAG